MKRILLLGATGSIGLQTVDVIEQHPDKFCLVGIAAGHQADVMQKIIDKHPTIQVAGISDVSTREAVEQALDAMFIAKLGSRDAVTPSEIMLAITGVTSSFGLISPIAPVAPEQNEALVLGVLAWQ